jgi:hypothetical protein
MTYGLFQLHSVPSVKGDENIIFNGEWVRIWKEVVVAYSKILSLYLTGKTEEYHEALSQDSE